MLWSGIVLPILAFILQQQASFLLTPFVCHTGNRAVLYVVSVVALLIAAAGGFIARSAFRSVPERPPEELDRTSARRRFMALAGMLTSVLFCLVVIAMAIPGFVHRPCD
jgi:archaellum biogenesis protein FlaJ (TadC family)